jgi:hypothetical protein
MVSPNVFDADWQLVSPIHANCPKSAACGRLDEFRDAPCDVRYIGLA